MDKVPLVIAIPWHRSSSSQTNSFRELSLGLSHRVWCSKNNYCQSTWYKLQWWHAICTMTSNVSFCPKSWSLCFLLLKQIPVGLAPWIYVMQLFSKRWHHSSIGTLKPSTLQDLLPENLSSHAPLLSKAQRSHDKLRRWRVSTPHHQRNSPTNYVFFWKYIDVKVTNFGNQPFLFSGSMFLFFSGV